MGCCELDDFTGRLDAFYHFVCGLPAELLRLPAVRYSLPAENDHLPAETGDLPAIDTI